jgi:hypothetical protein
MEGNAMLHNENALAVPPTTLTASEWRATGEVLASQHKKHQWLTADWVLVGLESLPATYVYDIAEQLFPEYTRDTLINMASVARSFPASSRDDALSFHHYRAVLSARNHGGELNEACRAEWLRAAKDNGWSVAQLRYQIAHSFELKMAEKEAAEAEAQPEPKAEAQPEAKATPRSNKGKARPAFTLEHLPINYREKLEKLSVARRMPVDMLALEILEGYLDQAVEEIAVVEARAAEASRTAHASHIAREAASVRAHIEQLIQHSGGTEAECVAAIRERKQLVKMGGEDAVLYNDFAYASWRFNHMEDDAWAENEEWEQWAAKRRTAKRRGGQAEVEAKAQADAQVAAQVAEETQPETDNEVLETYMEETAAF